MLHWTVQLFTALSLRLVVHTFCLEQLYISLFQPLYSSLCTLVSWRHPGHSRGLENEVILTNGYTNEYTLWIFSLDTNDFPLIIHCHYRVAPYNIIPAKSSYKVQIIWWKYFWVVSESFQDWTKFPKTLISLFNKKQEQLFSDFFVGKRMLNL